MNKMSRILRRFVVAAACLLLLPALVWWVANRIDDVPSPAARGLSEPFPATLKDADNAWLYLLGIGAPEGVDPLVHGRQLIDAYEASRGPMQQSGKQEASGPSLAATVVYLGPDQEHDGSDALCSMRDADCIAWSREHAELLEKLAQRNAVLLARLDTVLAMPLLEESATPSLDEPLPNLAIAGLHHNLLALQLGDAAHVDVALQRLAASAAFWRRVSEQARSQYAKRIAGARLEGVYRLLAEWTSRSSDSELHSRARLLREILIEPSAQQGEWEATLRHEFQQFRNSVSAQMVRSPGDLWRCLRSSRGQCGQEWLMGQAYAPQATLNLLANQMMARLALHRAAPGAVQSHLSEFSRLWEAQNPLRDRNSMLHMLARNATGKTLAAIASPALGFVYEEHDREALRRMLMLKLEAVVAGVDAEGVAVFSAALAGLHDPYTDAPFGWDVVRREWWFEPQSAKWAKSTPRLTHGIDAPVPVRACAQAFALRLELVWSADDIVDLGPLQTCADGRRDAAWLDPGDDVETFGYSTRDSAARLMPIPDENGELRDALYFSTTVVEPDRSRFEIRNAQVTEGMYIELAGRDEMAFLTLLDPPQADFVSLHVMNQPLQAVARALQGAHGARLQGIERLPDERLTMLSDLPLREVVAMLADAGGLRIREPEPRRFVFEAAH